VQNSPIQVKGRSTVSLVRKLSRLEAGGSSILFPCENWVECEILVNQLRFEVGESFTVKNALFGPTAETLVSYGTKQCVRGRSVLHVVSLWELSYLLRGILPTFQGSQVWGTLPLCQRGPLNWMEVTVSLVRKSSTLEAVGSSTLFSFEKWVSLLKEYLRFESILKWKNHSLYENYLLQTKCRNTCILWMNSMC
jgi:hypothetical protein